MEVTLNDAPMMYLVAEGGPAGAKDAFNQLEGKLSSLRGRKFYGTFQPETGEYRACVALESGEIPSGWVSSPASFRAGHISARR